MSDAHRLSTPRGLALARMLATVPRSARLGHSSALPPPSCSLISPLLSAACARPRPPRTAGRARCHRRSLLRPRSQSPHSHVQQSLHRRAATDLLRSQPACPRAPPPSCSRRCGRLCLWPDRLGLPPGHPRQPEGAHGPPCAAPPLLVAVWPPASPHRRPPQLPVC